MLDFAKGRVEQLVIIAILLVFQPLEIAWGEQAATLDELLDFVKKGQVQETQENKNREQKFKQEKGKQKQLLDEAKKTIEMQQNRSLALEQKYRNNEARIKQLNEKLRNRLGSLKELFGILQQTAGDTRSVFENSIISAEYPGREKFLDQIIEKMASESELASIEDMEKLWFELQREMTESGKVTGFESDIIFPDGREARQLVTRVGVFNLISEGRYLNYTAETQKIVELPRQPRSEFVSAASHFENNKDNFALFGLDPSRGQILKLLMQTPNLTERVEQGGLVGYAILALGAFAFLITIIKLLSMFWVKAKVMAQVRNDTPDLGNPLGRVLQVYEDNPKIDCETLELKLTEAILKEKPSIERFTTMIKIIAVVAPLMGLLGTVIGMINTFQAITLFGTGDPKLMAGGISQALVTTVLGLCVAIPTVLLHSLVHGQSRSIMGLLEMETAGIVADHREKDSDVVA